MDNDFCSGKPELVIQKKAAKIEVYKKAVRKKYLAKYYGQRIRCETKGEPWILDRYKCPYFVEMYDFYYNPYLSVKFLKHENKIKATYTEWVVLERLSHDISNKNKMIKNGLIDKLLEWLKCFRSDYKDIPIYHRDIQKAHIMYSKKNDTFKLIDFAVAVAKKGRRVENTNPRWDDIKQIDNLIREYEEYEE